MVSTHLENIRQIGSFLQGSGWKPKMVETTGLVERTVLVLWLFETTQLLAVVSSGCYGNLFGHFIKLLGQLQHKVHEDLHGWHG